MWTAQRIDRMIHREGLRLPDIPEHVAQIYDSGRCDFDETAGQWFRENRSFDDWDFNPALLAFWEEETLPTILLRSISLTFRVIALRTIEMGSTMWDDASILVYDFSDTWKLDLISVQDLRICSCRQLIVMRIAFRFLATLEPSPLWPHPNVWAKGFELVTLAARGSESPGTLEME